MCKACVQHDIADSKQWKHPFWATVRGPHGTAVLHALQGARLGQVRDALKSGHGQPSMAGFRERAFPRQEHVCLSAPRMQNENALGAPTPPSILPSSLILLP